MKVRVSTTAFARVASLLGLIIFVVALGLAEPPRPIFTVQLESQQMRVSNGPRVASEVNPKAPDVVDYSGVQFLTDNLLLVSLNVRVLNKPAYPLFADQPDSTLVLFGINQKKLLGTASYPVEKSSGAVHATENGQFVVLNQEGVHVCRSDLTCGPPFATNGPIRVLPGGTKLLVGGNRQTDVDLLDASTLQVLSSPAPRNLSMGLMSGVFLAPREARGGLAMSQGQGEIINETTVARFDSSDGQIMTIRKVDGGALYTIPITASYETTLAANRTGSRFCALEQSYTRWNRIVNFLDIDSSRPHNFARVRVFDTASGKQLFETHWDPRPSQIAPSPALSPDGHKLALIRHSELEVFDIP